MKPPQRKGQPKLSIGALSRATGLPADTLRTWERRYGFPRPERKASGHRQYSLAMLPRLRSVAQALALGHRAADVLKLDDGTLAALLMEATIEPPPPGQPRPEVTKRPATTAALLRAVRAFDAARLRSALEVAAVVQNPVQFMEGTLVRLMRSIGDSWRSGKLGVRHEHFATAVVAEVLRGLRRRLDPRPGGPVAVLAMLPGDAHELGLLMASVVFAEAGWNVIYLGLDTPLEQIVALATDTPVRVVALSIPSTAPPRIVRLTAALQSALPEGADLILGGVGAERVWRAAGGAAAREGEPRTFTIFRNLHDLEAWLPAAGPVSRAGRARPKRAAPG